MTVETIAGKLAGSILNNLATLGYRKMVKGNFTNFEQELSKIIQESIAEYKEQYPILETDKIPFYTSMVLMEEFFKFRYSGELNKSEILKAIENDERIIAPTEEQLLKFFEIFNSKVQASDKLKDLNIQTNYKEEIFKISDSVKQAKDLFITSVNEIKTQLNSLSVTFSLIGEWSKQLYEILDNFLSMVGVPTDQTTCIIFMFQLTNAGTLQIYRTP